LVPTLGNQQFLARGFTIGKNHGSNARWFQGWEALVPMFGNRSSFKLGTWRKHISNSKRTKHTILRPLLEVEMSKKCTPLWRETHFQVKMFKTHIF
jgi:hypothetical protein